MKCPDCVFGNCIKIKDNLYKCENCFFEFVSGEGVFYTTDLKRCFLTIKSSGVDINLRLHIYDLIKIMSLLKRNNSKNYYYKLLKDFLKTYEKESKTEINFDRIMPKYNLKELLK